MVTQLFILTCFLGITTVELDNLSAETCAYMNIIHPDYSKLAARIAVSNLHKQTPTDYKTVIELLRSHTDKVGRPSPLLAEDVYEIMQENVEKIQAKLDYNRDFSYDFFGFKTLERAYLLRVNNKVVERP